MTIHHDIVAFKKLTNGIATIGIFDGVHIGHKKILQSIVNESIKCNGESVVITFWPHPRIVLANDRSLKLLNTIDEKIALIKDAGIDHLIIIPFTNEFAETSAESFSKNILADKIGTKLLFIGYDHRFGRNKEGSFEYLKENAHRYGFEVREISRQDVDNLAVSSTRIRESIEVGQIEVANELLGHSYEIHGTVIKGRQLGRTIGFPTANIELDEINKMLPKIGVYAVKISIDDSCYFGMLNIGVKPTFNDNNLSIEVNIFDFDKDIYHKKIGISFEKRIRNEQKFASVEELKQQLIYDKETCLRIFQLV